MHSSVGAGDGVLGSILLTTITLSTSDGNLAASIALLLPVLLWLLQAPSENSLVTEKKCGSHGWDKIERDGKKEWENLANGF